MTDKPYLAVDGSPAQSLSLYVPAVGPWFAQLCMVDELSTTPAKKTITVGENFKAVGTISIDHDGEFAGERRTRIVAGAGAWGKQLPSAPPYRNDAGVRAKLVAEDVARACGETLGTFAGGLQVLGVKYVRNAGVASRTIEDAARGVSWWVDFAGVTQVMPHTPVVPKADSIQLLDFDTNLNRATLIVDDLTQIGIGTVINDARLPRGPIVVGAYEVHITQTQARVIAWCDGVKQSPIVDALRSIVNRSTDSKLFGKYRYRVVTVEVDRVNIQATSKADGLPDLLSVPMAPGVAGVHAKLALGSLVFVEFIAGDRADPEITGFSGRGTPGFVPDAITIGAATDAEASEVARKGDGVELVFPPFTLQGTMLVSGNPTPFTAVGFGSTGKLLGAITGGSTHGVKSG